MLSQLTTLLGLGPAPKEIELQKGEAGPFDFASIYSETDTYADPDGNELADAKSELIGPDPQEPDTEALIDGDLVEPDGEDFSPDTDARFAGDGPKSPIGSGPAEEFSDRRSLEKQEMSETVSDRQDLLAEPLKESAHRVDALKPTMRQDQHLHVSEGAEAVQKNRNVALDTREPVERRDAAANPPKRAVSKAAETPTAAVTDQAKTAPDPLPSEQKPRQTETREMAGSRTSLSLSGDWLFDDKSRVAKLSEKSETYFPNIPNNEVIEYKVAEAERPPIDPVKGSNPLNGEMESRILGKDNAAISLAPQDKSLKSEIGSTKRDKSTDLPIFGLQRRLLSSRQTSLPVGKPLGSEVAGNATDLKVNSGGVDSVPVAPNGNEATLEVSDRGPAQPSLAETTTSKGVSPDPTSVLVDHPAKQRGSAELALPQNGLQDGLRSALQGIAKSDDAPAENAAVPKSPDRLPLGLQSRLDGGGPGPNIDPTAFVAADPKLVERGVGPLPNVLGAHKQTQIDANTAVAQTVSESKLKTLQQGDEPKAANVIARQEIMPKIEMAEANVDRVQEVQRPFVDAKGSVAHLRQNAAKLSSDQIEGARTSEMVATVKPAVTSPSAPIDAQNLKGVAEAPVKAAGEKHLRNRDARETQRGGWGAEVPTNTMAKAPPIQNATVVGMAREVTGGDRNLGVTSPFLAGSDDLSHERFVADLPVGAAQAEVRATPGAVAQPLTPTRIEVHQVLRQIADGAARMTDGEIEIRLSPEELGGVRMHLVRGESSMTVHITADRQETLDLMRRNIDQLARDLADAGYEGAEFSFGGDASDGRNSDSRRDGAPGDTAVQQEPDIPRPPPSALVSDGLDLRF